MQRKLLFNILLSGLIGLTLFAAQPEEKLFEELKTKVTEAFQEAQKISGNTPQDINTKYGNYWQIATEIQSFAIGNKYKVKLSQEDLDFLARLYVESVNNLYILFPSFRKGKLTAFEPEKVFGGLALEGFARNLKIMGYTGDVVSLFNEILLNQLRALDTELSALAAIVS